MTKTLTPHHTNRLNRQLRPPSALCLASSQETSQPMSSSRSSSGPLSTGCPSPSTRRSASASSARLTPQSDPSLELTRPILPDRQTLRSRPTARRRAFAMGRRAPCYRRPGARSPRSSTARRSRSGSRSLPGRPSPRSCPFGRRRHGDRLADHEAGDPGSRLATPDRP